ncbi:hypothetical protein [Nocardia sp. IFM 10818]
MVVVLLRGEHLRDPARVRRVSADRHSGAARGRGPARTSTRPTLPETAEGWRYILHHPHLRPLFFNTVLVSALIMAIAPLCAILFLRELGFAPWQYGLPGLGELPAAALGTRPAIALAGLLILTTPLLLPRTRDLMRADTDATPAPIPAPR